MTKKSVEFVRHHLGVAEVNLQEAAKVKGQAQASYTIIACSHMKMALLQLTSIVNDLVERDDDEHRL